MKAADRPRLALGILAAAVVACAQVSGGRDIPATVNSVNTAVARTLTARTAAPPILAATLTPEATLTPVSVVTPTLPPAGGTDAAPPEATRPPQSTATPSEVTRGGPTVHAAHRPSPPGIDGDLQEWTLHNFASQVVFKPENWSGSEDLSVSFAAAWDADDLYLAAWVVDNVHVQTQHGALIYQGDSLEALFDADLPGDGADTHLSADDYQLGLSPGSLAGDGPEAFLWYPASRAGPPAGVTLAARKSGSGEGYFLEAAVPWSLFNVTPAAGDQFGFALSASDNDTPGAAEQQKLITTVSTRRLTDPTTWGLLVLDN